MSQAMPPIRLTAGDSLTYENVRSIRFCLDHGGFVVLPSDTGYSLACLPFRQDTITKLRAMLGHPNTSIPLSFGSYAMAARYVAIATENDRIVDHHAPGPLTIVCPMRPDMAPEHAAALASALHTEGTIGVRFPDSAVERQISIECDRPITTCAIRSADGEIVRSFDDALSIVRQSVEELGVECFLAAVNTRVIKYPMQSTVATADPHLVSTPSVVKVYRHGAIEAQDLQNSVKQLGWSDFEDWT